MPHFPPASRVDSLQFESLPRTLFRAFFFRPQSRHPLHMLRSILLSTLLLITAVIGLHMPAHAAKATKEEAIALVKKGVAHYKTHGPDKSWPLFSDPAGPYRDRELFLVVLDNTGTVMAHSVLKKMIGANLMQFKDINGVFMVKDMFAKAKKDGHGWSVEYLFLNPDTCKMEPKVSYFEKAGDYLFFCGVYK